MTIFVNDMPVQLPNDYMTLQDYIVWKNLNAQGTALAVNDRLVKQDLWKLTKLNELDRLTVISAAYGG